MHRFFIKNNNIYDNYVIIEGEDVNHITKSLRLSQKDIIIVLDEFGKAYTVSIRTCEKTSVIADIVSCERSKTEPPIAVTLFQALPKAAKMEYIIQKTTELGIERIVPVNTKRTVVKIEDKKSEQKKLERWQKVALEAAKQSHRGLVPQIAELLQFEQAITQAKAFDLVLFPYELESANRLQTVLANQAQAKSIAIFVGPEGGFDATEVELASQIAQVITLGPRILRTETAGAALLAVLMYALGDW
ncbi:MAG: 16S rRNA (uracil(1498)-N(3))-methyltransferase [Hyphomonadaceae bacterium]|nr:16S rRNA (uracil(1498)-N(3))-methyltransferase [Clostridia bacterium]